VAVVVARVVVAAVVVITRLRKIKTISVMFIFSSTKAIHVDDPELT
jgi:hypothetical protein